MMNFTQTDSYSFKNVQPSERSLNFIRQYAYAWNALKANTPS